MLPPVTVPVARTIFIYPRRSRQTRLDHDEHKKALLFNHYNYPISMLYDNDAIAWNVTLVTLLVTVTTTIFFWLAPSSPAASHRCGNSGNDTKASLPPFSPASFWEVVKRLPGETSQDFLEDQAKAIGCSTYRLSLPPLPGLPPLFVVGDPQLLNDIWKDPTSTKPKALYAGVKSMFKGVDNIGTITDDFHAWKVRRKGAAPTFASHNLKRMTNAALQGIEKWSEFFIEPSIDNASPFDIAKEMIQIAIVSICQHSFDYTLSREEAKTLGQDLDLAVKEFALNQMTNPCRRILFQLLGPYTKEMTAAVAAAERTQSLVYKIMKASRENLDRPASTLIESILSNSGYNDDEERYSDILLFIFAGHDTTAYTLAFTLRYLAMNPQEQIKLRQSLLMLPVEERVNCKALKHVVQESMRLSPVASMAAFRQLGRDFVLSNGDDDNAKILPKGSIALMGMYLAHRHPDAFPDDPLAFRPSRWDQPQNSTSKAAFIPFGRGSRDCVGQRLAIAHIHTALAYWIARYEFTIVEKGKAVLSGTLRLEGCRLQAHRV